VKATAHLSGDAKQLGILWQTSYFTGKWDFEVKTRVAVNNFRQGSRVQLRNRDRDRG